LGKGQQQMVNIINWTINWNNKVYEELGWKGCVLIMIGALWASNMLKGISSVILFVAVYLVMLDIASNASGWLK
jgi:hypothetical protein